MSANGKMKEIFQNIKMDEKKLKIILERIKDTSLMNPNFFEIHGSIVVSDSPFNISEEGFENLLRMYGDRTGYEASLSEMRVNDFIDDKIFTLAELLKFTLVIVDIWSDKLKNTFVDSSFCFIISCTENRYITFRFHKMRENELMYLNSDLEKYEEPVGYIVIDKLKNEE